MFGYFCFQERAVGSRYYPREILHPSEFTALIELKIFILWFLSTVEHLEFVYPQLRHLQSMQRLLLLKEHLGGYGKWAGGDWSNFSEPLHASHTWQ